MSALIRRGNNEYNFFKKFYFPIHTLSLFLTCIILYYSVEDNVNDYTLHIPVSSKSFQENKWYSYITCLLFHVNAYHLWNNMSVLLLLGTIFEFVHGPIPSFIVFWIAGVTGIMTEAVWTKTPYRLLGASSGVYALATAYLAHLIMNWKETPLRIYWFIAFIASVIVTVIFSYTNTEEDYSVADLAHLGGAIQGLFVGCLAVRNIHTTLLEIQWSIVCFCVAVGFILSLWYRVMLVLFYLV
tara:strand:+ start:135 stop:857 length:723 start_codon:yes stop_codon:yes gene_type:complete